MLPVMSDPPRPLSRVRRWGRVLVGAGAFGILLYFADVRAVGAALRGADAMWVGLAVLANFAARLLAAERNLSISRALALPLRRAHAIAALFIANFWSLLLPGVSAGSVATVIQYRRQGVSGHSSLGVLGASRIVEISAFGALALVGLALAARDADRGLRLALLTSVGLAIAAVAVGLIVLRLIPPPAPDGGAARRSLGGRALAFAGKVAASIRALQPRDYLRSSGIAAVQALFDALIMLCLSRALLLDLSFADCLWVNGLSYFTILLPVSVAGLGMREAAIITALAPLGVARDPALALALLMLAATLLNALVGAAVQLWGTHGGWNRRSLPAD